MTFAIATSACTDRIDPPPRQIDHMNVALPSGVSGYCRLEETWLDLHVLIRFDLPIGALPALEMNLPCRLGAIEDNYEVFSQRPKAPHRRSGPGWYTPDAGKRLRRYDHQCHSAGVYSNVVVDVTDPERATVYIEFGT
jgi:hypothetical protein